MSIPVRSAVAARRTPSAWWVTAAVGAGVIAVAYGFARYAYGLFVPEFRAAFGLSGTGVGVVGGLSTAGYAVGLAVAPALAVRGARATAVLAGLFAAAGVALMAAAPGAGVLAVGVAVAGTSAGLASPALAQVVSDHVAERHQGPAQTWTNTGTSVGLAVSAFAPLLAVGWRGVWVVFALIALAVTGIAWAALPGRGASSPRPEVPGPARRPAGSPPPTGVARLALVSLVLGVTSAPYWNFSRERVLELGLGGPASTAFWFTIGIAGLLGGLAGYVAIRWGLRRTYRVALGLWIVACALLWSPAAAPILVFASAALFGAAYMALTGLCILWGARLYPGASSRGVTVSFLALAVGQTLGAPVAGAVADVAGLGLAFGAAALVSAAALLAPPPREPRAPTDRPDRAGHPVSGTRRAR